MPNFKSTFSRAHTTSAHFINYLTQATPLKTNLLFATTGEKVSSNNNRNYFKQITNIYYKPTLSLNNFVRKRQAIKMISMLNTNSSVTVTSKFYRRIKYLLQDTIIPQVKPVVVDNH